MTEPTTSALAWDGYSTDKKRSVMLQVLGRMKVVPAGPDTLPRPNGSQRVCGGSHLT